MKSNPALDLCQIQNDVLPGLLINLIKRIIFHSPIHIGRLNVNLRFLFFWDYVLTHCHHVIFEMRHVFRIVVIKGWNFQGNSVIFNENWPKVLQAIGWRGFCLVYAWNKIFTIGCLQLLFDFWLLIFESYPGFIGIEPCEFLMLAMSIKLLFKILIQERLEISQLNLLSFSRCLFILETCDDDGFFGLKSLNL